MMRLRFKLLLYFVLFAQLASAQFFEGRIEFTEKYEPGTTIHTSAEKFGELFGTKRITYWGRNYYQSVTNGKWDKNVQVYSSDENKLYFYDPKADTVYWIDVNHDTSALVGIPHVEDSDEVIMGLPCKKLEFITKSKKTVYYFNEKFPLSYNDVQRFHFQHMDDYARLAKSMTLKMSYETKLIRYTMTATKIVSEKVNREIKLPQWPQKKVF